MASPQEDVSSDTRCKHFNFATVEMSKFLKRFKSLKNDPECKDCKHEATVRQLTPDEPDSCFMMCSGCSQCFCTISVTNEDGSMGNARSHANSACHPVALWIDQPDAAYCFQCDSSLDLKVITLMACSHEFGYAVRGISNRWNTCYVNALVQCLLALDELWMLMLGPHAPAGSLGVALKGLFLESRSGNNAGVTFNPWKLLKSLEALNQRYGALSQKEEQRVDSIPSIKERLEYCFRKEVVIKYCEICSDEKPTNNRNKDGGQMVGIIRESTSVDRDQTVCDNQEEKSDLLSAHDNQDISMLNQDRRKHLELESSAHQVGEAQNKQKDMGGPTDKTFFLSKLPSVLTLHVLRFKENDKRMGRVKFEENLDVGEYMDPRSEDKGNARYRLVGVIEHIGSSIEEGYHVAYVRGNRIVSEQKPTSSSSSWFYANDDDIREVSLDEVLMCEAFLLFYERIDRRLRQ
nr:unnamed protein product [Digitaria exilis]